MKWYESAGIGVVLGILYGITLWASVDALSLVSFMNYGDKFYMPIRVTVVVMFFAFVFLFSVPIWYPYAESAIMDMGEELEVLNKQRTRKTRMEYPHPRQWDAVTILERMGKGGGE